MYEIHYTITTYPVHILGKTKIPRVHVKISGLDKKSRLYSKISELDKKVQTASKQFWKGKQIQKTSCTVYAIVIKFVEYIGKNRKKGQKQCSSFWRSQN